MKGIKEVGRGGEGESEQDRGGAGVRGGKREKGGEIADSRREK